MCVPLLRFRHVGAQSDMALFCPPPTTYTPAAAADGSAAATAAATAA